MQNRVSMKIQNNKAGKIIFTNKVGVLFSVLMLNSIIASILNSSIPYCDYFLIICNYILVIIFGFSINRKALKSASILAIILTAGLIWSMLIGINNTSIPLVIAISLNCLLYMSLAYGKIVIVNPRDLHIFFNISVLIGVISCIYNIIINGSTLLTLNLTLYSYSANFSSFYGGRNTFAILLCIFLLSAVYMFKKTKKMKYLFCSLIFIINLIFTFSRSSIIFAVIFCGLFMIKSSKRSVIKKIFLFFLLVISIWFILWLLNNYYDWINHYLIRSDVGDAYRFDYWRLALERFFQSPVVGFGPGSTEKILQVLGNKAGSSFHNTYIEILSWGGLQLALFYIICMKEVYYSLKIIKKNDEILYNFYYAFIVGLIVYALFETTMIFGMGGRQTIVTLFVYVLPIQFGQYYLRQRR